MLFSCAEPPCVFLAAAFQVTKKPAPVMGRARLAVPPKLCMQPSFVRCIGRTRWIHHPVAPEWNRDDRLRPRTYRPLSERRAHPASPSTRHCVIAVMMLTSLYHLAVRRQGKTVHLTPKIPRIEKFLAPWTRRPPALRTSDEPVQGTRRAHKNHVAASSHRALRKENTYGAAYRCRSCGVKREALRASVRAAHRQ